MNGDIPFGPVVLVQQITINVKAVWGVSKAGQSARSLHRLLCSLPCGVDANHLHVFLTIFKLVDVLNDEYFGALHFGSPVHS